MSIENDKVNLKTPAEDLKAAELRYRQLLESARNGIVNLDVVNEIRYRRLFESNRDGILILDAKTRKITDANPFMIDLLGYSEDEFIGKELWEIGLLKDEEASKAAFHELQQKGYIRYTELPLETKKGERRDVEFISNVYTEDNRQIIQCNIHDITGRKTAEEALTKLKGDLKLAELEYQRVLDNSLDVICQINENGHFTHVSAAAKKVWGYEPEQLIGNKNSLEFVHPDDRAKTAQARIDIRSGNPTSTFENRYIRKDGSIAHMMWSANWSESDNTVFCVARDVSQIKQAEQALKESEANYRNLIESSPGIIYLIEPDPPYSTIYVSPNITKFGYSSEAWYTTPDMWIKVLHPEDRERVLREFESAVRRGVETDLEYRIVASDSSVHWWHDKGGFVLDSNGKRIGWQGLIVDITSIKDLREQLRQSQKLESVGMLAGGIAHDFNNMLTAINGYSDLILRKLEFDDPLRLQVEEIKKAGQRSAELTHQLLAFSRQQMLQPVVLDLNEIINETSKMLQRVIGEDIQLTTTLSSKVGRIKVDPGQFSQIILNLAVNARDSMPRGGKLTIETANVFLDPNYARQHIGVLPGAYVMVAVSDTGTGINDEIKQHIFEPFFTTKEVGRGTGLGLATVYGIVKQSGGSIEVYSEEGVGTTFKIYLPRVMEAPVTIETKEPSEEMPGGTETILLVEDEEMVRNLSRMILEECGYTVIEAVNGMEALSIFERGDLNINLLMTDVVMPQMGGRELSDQLILQLPNIKVLFTSGYTGDAIIRHGMIDTNTNFIQKPFSPEALASKIREILDTPEKS